MTDFDSIERAAARAGVDPREFDPFQYDSYEDITDGDVWIAGEADELVRVSVCERGESAETCLLELEYLDREAFDGGEYSYVSTAYRLFERMRADGGWYAVPLFYTESYSRCPRCGGFTEISGGRTEFPWIQCSMCGATADEDYLVRSGDAIEVLL